MEKSKKFSLHKLLMHLDVETLAMATMLLMALQPLYGVFDIVREQSDLIALFYGKATLIRFVGMFGLFVGFVNLYQCSVKYGAAYFQKKFLHDPWNLIFALALVWAVMTSLTAVNKEIAFFSYAYRYEGLLSYFAYAGVYICGSMIRDEGKRRRLIDFFLIIAAVLAVVTWISQQPGNTESLLVRSGWVGAYSGTFINTNHYGYFLCVVLMLSAGRMVYARGSFKVFFIASFILNTLILLKNNSFGPFLAVSVGLVGFFVVTTIRDGIEKSWWLVIPFAAFFILDAWLNDGAMIKMYEIIWTEFRKVLGYVTSSEAELAEEAERGTEAVLKDIGDAGSGRMRIWMAAFDVWKQHPVIGCGPENLPMEMQPALGGYEACHNEYLQVLAEMGIIGFITYWGGHLTNFVYQLKRMGTTSNASLVAYGAAAAYLVSAAFGITITVSEVFFFFVLGIANGSHNADIMNSLEGPALNAGEMLRPNPALSYSSANALPRR